jgi:hypothetical protein
MNLYDLVKAFPYSKQREVEDLLWKSILDDIFKWGGTAEGIEKMKVSMAQLEKLEEERYASLVAERMDRMRDREKELKEK